ncbi:serine hydrolase domain-containing protein [Streptomyces sp. NRRL WC-3742]|uniref:serine hydrolase domain-containing protein n=1 Tax=Streptomyces sp. NRRL WC-3742 TaxID=1463934 RepID=UPI00068DB050|nr:serine hydrolase domain-containing protein [Streptomyces sp. NRRL WC-3742]
MPSDPTRARTARTLLGAALAGGLLLCLAPAAAARPLGGPAADGCHSVHYSVDGRQLDESYENDESDDTAVPDSAEWSAADASLKGMTDTGYSTAALAAVRQDGRLVWRNAGGIADLDTRAPADPRGRFRIGSATKTFVATTLLQLVGEGRLDLDDRLECLLPGIVAHSTDITVRRLMNHTSGVAEYTKDPAFEFFEQSWLTTRRYRSYSLRDLVDIANRYPPDFAPGQDWNYSNTNYVLVAMIIEKLTGHPWNDEVTRRIIRPLHLTGTSAPADFPFVPGPHAHGYFKLGTGPVDVTVLNPSMAGPSGGIISTTADLTAFLRALLGGRLLRPAELAAMQRTTDRGEGRTYGLGLQRMDTPCGAFWGHAGGIPGYLTMMLSSPDGGRQVAASTNPYDVPDEAAARAAWSRVSTTALCGTGAPATAADPLR